SRQAVSVDFDHFLPRSIIQRRDARAEQTEAVARFLHSLGLQPSSADVEAFGQLNLAEEVRTLVLEALRAAIRDARHVDTDPFNLVSILADSEPISLGSLAVKFTLLPARLRPYLAQRLARDDDGLRAAVAAGFAEADSTNWTRTELPPLLRAAEM